MRRPHIIRGNEASTTVRHALFFDTETTQHSLTPTKVVHRLAFGWCEFRRRRDDGTWTGGAWSRFASREEFWDLVESRALAKIRLVLVCHNTGFDLSVLDPFFHLASRGWTLSTACIDAPPTILRWRKGTLQIQIIDSLNFWRQPLAVIGARVGLSKLDMPAGWADAEIADAYCRRDVEIVSKAMREWWDWLLREDMGGAAPTLASQAMRAYRHRFMPHSLYVDDCGRANSLARDAYHGGRVECFRLGECVGSFHLLDVHSMYPYVMRDGLMPVRLLHAVRRYSVQKLSAALEECCVVADVTLDTDEPAYPVRDRAKLYFPIGRYRACLTTPELRHALAAGRIVEVHRVAVYEARPIFGDFVREMYRRRKEAESSGDAVGAHALKILMNSLYGKFGQSGVVWETIEHPDDLDAAQWSEISADSGLLTRYRKFGGIVQEQQGDAEGRDSMPAIAAHVTGYARAYLWSLITQAGRDHVLYCDTDSLLVDDIGLARLDSARDEESLGTLGYEGNTARARLWGCKDYDLGFKTRHKGVRKSAVWTAPDVVEQEQWSGLSRALFDEKVDGPTTATIRKRLYRRYDKGVVGPGGLVSPHVLALET